MGDVMEPVLLWIAIIVAPLISAGIVGIAMSIFMDRERTRILGEVRTLSTRHLSALKQLQSENGRALQALKAEWIEASAGVTRDHPDEAPPVAENDAPPASDQSIAGD